MRPSKRHSRLVAIATNAALQAGEYLRTVRRADNVARKKESIHSVVTPYDLRAQAIIEAAIRDSCPDTQIISEEKEDSHEALASSAWVIDPLDGTSYFTRGLRSYSISIAFVEHGRPLVGVIYSPQDQELCWGLDGAGAFLNEEPLSVSDLDDPGKAIVTLGHRFLREAVYRPIAAKLLNQIRSIRAGGSCAQELLNLAAGRIDALVVPRQSLWDFAAGLLIVAEAGGTFSRFDGSQNRFDSTVEKSEDVLATNGQLHSWFLSALAEAKR